MKSVRLETTEIAIAYPSTRHFKKLLRFSEWYGANMEAWIDCMSDFDNTKYGITEFKLNSAETLIIEVLGTESFAKRRPDVFTDLIACTASVKFVNQRSVGWGGTPVVNLAFL